MPDVHLHDVDVAVVGRVPHLVQDLGLAHHRVRPARQAGQDRELLGGQRDRGGPARTAPLRLVHDQITDPQQRRPELAATAQQGSHTGQQDDVRKRLGQIVVRPGVQRLRLVVLPILGRQHQHRRADSRLPQPGAHLETVHPRQQQIQNHGLITLCHRVLKPGTPVMNHIDGVTLSTQATTQRLGQFPLIFYNQQPHRAILPAPSPKILKSTSACDKGPAVVLRHFTDRPRGTDQSDPMSCAHLLRQGQSGPAGSLRSVWLPTSTMLRLGAVPARASLTAIGARHR